MNRHQRRKTHLEGLETRRMPATITVAPITVTEGTTNTQATFTARLDQAITSPVTLTYSTGNGTARAGQDYTATKGSVTIPAGSTAATFTVPILADNLSNEGNERFNLDLRTNAGNKVAARRVTATIVDGNPPPTVTASDLTIPEPTSPNGSKTGSVTIALSNPSAKAVRVSYSTVDGSAVSAGRSREYVGQSGSVVIRAGATSVKLPVRVFGRATSDETFNVALRSATNAVLSTVRPAGVYGRVVIQDSATATRPTVTVSSPTVTTGDAATFNVTLSAASSTPVSFRYSTSTASDITPVNNILTIPAGQTTGTIVVQTAPNSTLTTPETFNLNLASPANATLTTTTATATVNPNLISVPPGSILPLIALAGGSATVGATGTALLPFTITLSAASTLPVTVNYTTFDGTAVAGTDYIATAGTLVFAPGTTTQTVNVTVNGQTTSATSKTVGLRLANLTNATLPGVINGNSGTATGTINYTSPPVTPALSVSSPKVNVASTGTTTLTFNVNLSSTTTQTVTATYTTADGTALAGTDYTAASGTLTFAPGTDSQTVTITVNGTNSTVTSKTLSLNVTGTTNASNTTANGVGTLNYTVPGVPNVISDNLSNTTSGVVTAKTDAATGNTTGLAASFTSPGTNSSLNSATLKLATTDGGVAQVAVFTDNGGVPGTVVGFLTSTTPLTTTATNTTFSNTDGFALNPNTTYWIVLITTSGSVDWSYTTENTGAGTGFTGTWAQNDNHANWTVKNTSPVQMSVTVTPA